MTHHIMFDARFCSGKPHGIARVTHKLLEHLLPKSPHCRFTVLISNDHLKNKLPAQPSLRFIKANAKPYSIAEQWELPRIIRREKPDIFHSASFTMPLFSPAPVIVTIFDLIPVLFPKFFPLRYRIYYRIMVRRFCKRAEKIFTSSDNSRTDLMNLYGVPAEKIKVIHCAASDNREPSHTKKPNGTPYIMYMGNTMHHKNFFRAVEAFVLFKQRYTEQPVTLKVVGIPHAFYDSSRIKGTPCVDIIENVSDPQLYELMAHASVFFFPSLYEGFGLPPLEAMNLGTPVVASCTSSLPETLSDAYLPADPYNPREMADALYSVMTDSALRESLIKKGRLHALNYSWNTAAEKVIELYKEILQWHE